MGNPDERFSGEEAHIFFYSCLVLVGDKLHDAKHCETLRTPSGADSQSWEKWQVCSSHDLINRYDRGK